MEQNILLDEIAYDLVAISEKGPKVLYFQYARKKKHEMGSIDGNTLVQTLEECFITDF